MYEAAQLQSLCWPPHIKTLQTPGVERLMLWLIRVYFEEETNSLGIINNKDTKKINKCILVWQCVQFSWQMNYISQRLTVLLQNMWSSQSSVWNLPTNICSVRGSVMLPARSFHRTICLNQPCQNLPKGVACQSAQCVRTRQKPGRITSPAWPGAPSCPWTTAQLWTGNKRWEIGYKTTQVQEGPKEHFSTWVNRN